MLQLTQHSGFSVRNKTVIVNIANDVANFNARTALLAAGWNGWIDIDALICIGEGIKIYSATSLSPSFDTGEALPPGSTMTIVNRGLIEGKGRVGALYNGVAGEINGYMGGDAVFLRMPVFIDNREGYIFAGGGSGGGVRVINTDTAAYVRWAGGGGSQGNTSGIGGETGTTDTTGQTISTPGGTGSESTAGAGGVHSSNVDTYGSTTLFGGPGGGWGNPGGNGTVSYAAGVETQLGVGGAPGKAVSLNGFSAVFHGGNVAPRVLGAIS